VHKRETLDKLERGTSQLATSLTLTLTSTAVWEAVVGGEEDPEVGPDLVGLPTTHTQR